MSTRKPSGIIEIPQQSIEGHGDEFDEGNDPIGRTTEVVGCRVVLNVEIGFETCSKTPGNTSGRFDEIAT